MKYYRSDVETFNRKYREVYVSVNCARQLMKKFDQTGDVKDVKKRN